MKLSTIQTLNANLNPLTFYNGVEFFNWKDLESSIFTNQQRTCVYFAHAYSSWERGSNEIQNKMIRRFIPKGKDMLLINNVFIKDMQNWINNYPRKKLGYKSSNTVYNSLFQPLVVLPLNGGSIT